MMMKKILATSRKVVHAQCRIISGKAGLTGRMPFAVVGMSVELPTQGIRISTVTTAAPIRTSVAFRGWIPDCP